MKMLRKFGLVMWKNYILRKRHWIVTSFEIVIPVVLFIFAAVIRSLIKETFVEETYFSRVDEDLMSWQLKAPSTKLFYAPDNSFTNVTVENVKNSANMTGDVRGFDSEDQLVRYFSSINNSHNIFAVIFEDLPADESPPDAFKYKIRIADTYFHTSQLYSENKYGPGYSDSYIFSQFIPLQIFLDKAYMDLSGINSTQLKFSTQQFPYPEYTHGAYQDVFSSILPFITVLSFVMLCPSILKRIVEEKETGVKELMKMMGLKTWMLWLGWMTNSLVLNVLSISVIAGLLKAPFGDEAILPNSDGFLVWIVLLFYIAAGLMFCFAISSFFYRPTLAMSVGIFLWFTSYSATVYPVMNGSNVDPSLKLFSAVLPNTAISWCFRMMIEWETKDEGLTWGNFFEPPSGIEGDASVGLMWVMFIVDIFIYGIITWYVESVMPGKYGIAKPWYFPIMPSYWFSRKVSDTSLPSLNEDTNKKFEKPPSNLSVGIKIQNLRKVFQSLGGFDKKVAVDGVNLDIYNGEITALLGHNGAGKTTTMSILTGLYSATSGSVYINGYDIRKNLEKVRENLGLCPQHNLLFTDLTVFEHLIFFAMLKGCSKSDAQKEATELLEKMNLTEKKAMMCSTLSGGMKRKLSLGIALIGNTKVLMLDEPTSGLDPEARREMWDLLLSMRGQRTILITTHFMEEADVLGDRIAIMYHGKVQCFGTSLYLKKIYGTGYQLNLLKNEGCNVPKITYTIQETISDAEIKSEMGTVLSYMLPSEQTHNFPKLFEVLERDKQRLGISSIGVSITTLEEVFLRVGREAGDDYAEHSTDTISEEYMKINGNTESLAFKHNEGTSLMLQQLIALFKKRLIYTYREGVAFLIRAVFAIALAVATLLITSQPQDENTKAVEPALTLSLSDYLSTEVLYSPQYDPMLWSSEFESLVKSAGSSVRKVDANITEALMQIGTDNLKKYRTNFIAAAEFSSSENDTISINAFYSSIAYHAVPIAINLLSNTILRTENSSKSITVINHPLETNRKDEVNPVYDMGTSLSLISVWMTLMPYALLFLIGGFIKFPLTERVSKAKQLQMMTGVSPISYWFTCFMCDFIYYLIVTSIMVLGVYLADSLEVFSGPEELGVYFLLMLMYGLCGIPFAYLFSYFKKTSAGSFALLSILNLVFGMILALIVYAMQWDEDYKLAAEILKYILQLLPHFCITYGFMHFADLASTNNKCKINKIDCSLPSDNVCCQPGCQDGYCPAIYKPYLEIESDENPTAVGEQVLYMAINTILYVTIIMLVEYGVFEKLCTSISNIKLGSQTEGEELEEDVLREKERINSKMGETSTEHHGDDIMLVHNLMKKFKKNFVAVKGVSFGVYPGECFGLLGINGAGKTTTFRMLTGDEIASDGDALINNYMLRTDRRKFLAQIGYCPQFDAITEVLTGREMLKFIASLRGVSQVIIDYEVNKWIKLMGLQEYENRKCGTYSGGNKRKLSTAMALIGDPPIIFLDEPTSGVDPVARRNLWTVLTSIQKSGQSVVLTSHSMEECEALCNRLAIMVSGQFKCMGGIPYIKQKYGQGFTIMVKLRVVGTDGDLVNTLKTDIEEKFNPECVLKDEHQGLLHYHVTNSNTPWKHLFITMERIKDEYDIVEDYTISETTLEQVFLSFAKPDKSGESSNTEETFL